jgi:hypothetical protein
VDKFLEKFMRESKDSAGLGKIYFGSNHPLPLRIVTPGPFTSPGPIRFSGSKKSNLTSPEIRKFFVKKP